jgi:hypothetical protein
MKPKTMPQRPGDSSISFETKRGIAQTLTFDEPGFAIGVDPSGEHSTKTLPGLDFGIEIRVLAIEPECPRSDQRRA